MVEALAAFREDQVDIRIVDGAFIAPAAADLQHHRLAARAILQVMTVGFAGLEAGDVARRQQFLAIVRHQHHLAFEHIDQLVFGRMPVPLARPGSGRQAQEVHSELGQAGGIPQTPALARRAGFIMGHGVACALGVRGGGEIDLLGHGVLLAAS